MVRGRGRPPTPQEGWIIAYPGLPTPYPMGRMGHPYPDIMLDHNNYPTHCEVDRTDMIWVEGLHSTRVMPLYYTHNFYTVRSGLSARAPVSFHYPGWLTRHWQGAPALHPNGEPMD